MIKVYLCDECMHEEPYGEEFPTPCPCGAGQDAWVVSAKPESGCGGESK